MISSGASSASVLPLTTNTTPSAPAPADDPSQSFSDVLQQQSDAEIPAGKKPSATPEAATTPATGTTAPGTPTAQQTVTRSMTIVASATVTNARSPLRDTISLTTTALAAATAQATATISPVTATAGSASPANFTPGSTKSTAKTPVTPSVTPSRTAPAAPATTAATTTIASGSDMSTMMIQAMLHASQLQSSQHLPAVDAITSRPSSRGTATPSATTPSGAPNLSATAIPAALATKAAPTAATQVAAPAATTGQAVTAMAAAMSATGDSGSVSRTGIPLSGSAAAATSGAAKEKKSTTGTAEGSFLQAASAASTSSGAASNLTTTAVGAVDNSSGNQQVATQSSASKNVAGGLATSATSGVGTNRDEKRTTMNTDLNLPAMLAGANTSKTPEVNILLSSNTDFADALKQVIHIAQINDATGSATEPTRVAIELQTPPGAIVNVYVSKQDDSSYRAQLSTSDPAALSWVQDKIASLRQDNDMGVQVKWLPAQIESSSSLSATTPSSDGSNLNWNRDGQQHNNPTPDDQSQYQRQAPSFYEDDLTEADADTFASNFEAVGGAA